MRSLLVLLLPLLACTPRREAGAVGEEARPQVALTGVKLRVFRGDTLTALGRAARVTYLRDTGQMVATEAWVRLPRREQPGGPSQGAPSALPSARGGLEVRAREVAGNVGARQAVATGEVVVRGADGLVGRTTEAHYDGSRQHLSGNRPIQVRAPGSVVDAQGFDFDLDAEAYTFSGDVVTRLEGRR